MCKQTVLSLASEFFSFWFPTTEKYIEIHYQCLRHEHLKTQRFPQQSWFERVEMIFILGVSLKLLIKFIIWVDLQNAHNPIYIIKIIIYYLKKMKKK